MNELVVLDHFEHLLLLFSEVAVDFNVFGFEYQSRVERDDSFRDFFQDFIVHLLVRDFLIVSKRE